MWKVGKTFCYVITELVYQLLNEIFCYRLGSKSGLLNLGQIRSLQGNVRYAPAALPTMTIKKYEPPQIEHHDDKNERLKRPLSPHMTIYKFPMPAILSISHRASGKYD